MCVFVYSVLVCLSQRNEMTPSAGGNNRVREALERLVSTTIRKTEKIASRAHDEEQSSLKVLTLYLHYRYHGCCHRMLS